MQQKRDLAIVLKSVPYEERHRVVTALTEKHGRISALARNSIQSRRFGGALEPFAASEWSFVERVGANLYRVEEAQIRRSFDGLRTDFAKLSLASVFNELMMKLAPEREPCPDLFRLHSNALAALDEHEGALGDHAMISLLNGYLAKVMQWSGSQPQLSQCMACETRLEHLPLQQSVSCVVADAGWMCANCRGLDTRHVRSREGQQFHHASLRMSTAALRDFHVFLSAPIRQLPSLTTASVGDLRSLHAFLEALLEYHVPGYDRSALKSLRFLDLGSSAPHRAESFR